MTHLYLQSNSRTRLIFRPAKLYGLSDFYLWFSTGLEHIADWKGYDHILFLLALCGMYGLRSWKHLLVLITAFTVGHSITLALSVLDILKPKSSLIEFLIPITILLTCVLNLSDLQTASRRSFRVRYVAALFFGLIHGLGFSYLLKSLLGREENVVPPLFAFNIGLEAGQLLIVAGVLLLSTIVTSCFPVTEKDKNFFLSSAVFGVAFLLMLQRFPAG